MSQSNFLITGGAAPEGSGLNVRLRIQAAFLAAISHSCATTEPTTPYPNMFWVDETNGLLKQRNVTNDAWITKWDITKGQLATLASPTFNGEVNLPSTTYIGGFPVARTTAPIFTGNSTFETLTAWSSVSLPASTTIGAVSATELSYLDGVTSAIQSQLNAKQETLVSGTNIKTVGGVSLIGSGDVDVVMPTDYATSTIGGTVKTRISGSTLYLRTDGVNA